MTQRLYGNPAIHLDREVIWWKGLVIHAHGKQTTTKRRIGNTLFVVTSECALDATETIGSKLERIVAKPLSTNNSYQSCKGLPLASSANQSEYRVG